MILTVTPNPTIDRVLFVRNFDMRDPRQDVVRAEREVVSPSGKGIDVALILHEMGIETHAVALNAGRHGELLAALVAEQGLAVDWIAAQGETRMATLLTDLAVGRQSTILANTLHAQPQQMAQILARIDAHAERAWGLVSAGSVPPGLPRDAHAQIITRAAEKGLVTLLDSSGSGLAAGIQARPHILKINVAEFLALLQAFSEGQLQTDEPSSQVDAPRRDASRHTETPGMSSNGAGRHTRGDADFEPKEFEGDEAYPADPLEAVQHVTAQLESGGFEAILRLVELIEPFIQPAIESSVEPNTGQWARDAIVVTLGRQGILAVTQEGIYHAPALPVAVVSPAGAGDAVSAGIMMARSQGESWESALIWASALAAAVIGNAGTADCSRAQVMALAEEATVVALDASV